MSVVSNTTANGVRAIELFYHDIKRTSDGETRFMRSQMRLNGPSMGVLMPANYQPVSELSDQCVQLFELGFVQLLQAVSKFSERELTFDWLSLYMPIRFMKRGDAIKTVSDLCTRFKIKSDKICFEVSETLLDETDGTAAEFIDTMRERGYHFLLSEFGGSSCPVLRLSEFPVDYVILSAEAARSVCRSERSQNNVSSLISLVDDLGAESVADGTENSAQTEKLFDCGCSYYTGEFAGSYKAERYVRRRTE